MNFGGYPRAVDAGDSKFPVVEPFFYSIIDFLCLMIIRGIKADEWKIMDL